MGGLIATLRADGAIVLASAGSDAAATGTGGGGGEVAVNPWGDGRGLVDGALGDRQAARNEMRRWGYPFTGGGDSETALALYTKLGLNFVHHLRGEVAVVVADERERRVVAVRDRFGVRPLYYAVHRGTVLFASEVRALLALGVPARWDEAAFVAELWGSRPADRTLFQGIRAVPPACMAVGRPGRVEILPYWEPEPGDTGVARDAAAVELRALLEEAVDERLADEVEGAVWLDGGSEAAALLALARARRGSSVLALRLSLDEGRIVESFADAVCRAATLAVDPHAVARHALVEQVRRAGISAVLAADGAELVGGAPWPCPDRTPPPLPLLRPHLRHVRHLPPATPGARPAISRVSPARLPYLDHHVVEFAAGLPVADRGRVLRAALADLVPAEVQSPDRHRCLGASLLRGDGALAAYVEEVLRSSVLDAQPFFDPALVRASTNLAAQLTVLSTCILQQHFGLSPP